MQLIKVDTDRSRDIARFIDFPFDLYKNCPQWVPPLNSELQLVLNRKKHPFYKHSQADFFMVESSGEILGRIAILKNVNYCAHHKEEDAFFYYFESVDDAQVASLLFDAAKDWSRTRGCKFILGPKGFLRSNAFGLLVEGFEYLPALGIAYNYPYYASLVEAQGFYKETDHLSGQMDYSEALNPRIYEVAAKVKARSKFWIKSFNSKAEIRKWIPVVDRVHQEAFQDLAWYFPSTAEEFSLIAKTMIQIADPKLIKLIMSDREVAGFILAYADISKGLQKARGHLLPLGWLYLLLEQKRTKLVNLNGMGFLPRYQGLGGNALLYTELEKTLRQFQFEKAEFVQVDERNFKSKSDMETIGTHWHKRHRTYRLPLDNKINKEDL